MKKLLTLFLLTTLFVSCSSDDEPFLSNDAQVYSFTLKDNNDTSSILNKVNFAINQIDGVIYNPYILPSNTPMDNLNMNVSFNPIYGINKVRVITPTTSYIWDKISLIDFSTRAIYLEVVAPSGNVKKYLIDLKVY